MAVKTTKKATSKAAQKAISGSMPKRGLSVRKPGAKKHMDSGGSEVERAILSMTASVGKLVRVQAETCAELKELARVQAEDRAEFKELARVQAEASAETRAELKELARVQAEASAETRAELKELARVRDEDRAETRAELKELARVRDEDRAETRAELKELARVREEDRAEARAELEDFARVREEDRADVRAELKDLARVQKESIRAMEKTMADLAEFVKKLGGNVGDVNNRLGEIVELVVLPGLMEEMNTKCCYNFDNASPRKRFTDSGNKYAEIDLFFENGESVMAVEAKSRFTLGMVNDFVGQVESLRKHEIKAGVVGKKIYAAIAGIGIDANARAFALKKGIYVVDIDRSSNNVAIESPKGAVGTW